MWKNWSGHENMSDYEITIDWIQVWGDGCWTWSVHKDGQLLKTSTSLTKYGGLFFAKAFARRHAKGKIKPPPQYPSTFTYTVWDK